MVIPVLAFFRVFTFISCMFFFPLCSDLKCYCRFCLRYVREGKRRYYLDGGGGGLGGAEAAKAEARWWWKLAWNPGIFALLLQVSWWTKLKTFNVSLLFFFSCLASVAFEILTSFPLLLFALFLYAWLMSWCLEMLSCLLNVASDMLICLRLIWMFALWLYTTLWWRHSEGVGLNV